MQTSSSNTGIDIDRAELRRLKRNEYHRRYRQKRKQLDAELKVTMNDLYDRAGVKLPEANPSPAVQSFIDSLCS